MRYTKFQHWVKLQRKFRKTQKKLLISGDYKLTQKIESIKKRITALNHKWRLGISASVLTAWFAFSPAGNLQAKEIEGLEKHSSISSTMDTVTFVLNDSINDLVAHEDLPFSYQLSGDTCLTPNEPGVFNLNAQLVNGEELPTWLNFSAETRTFSGTPRNNDTGLLSILVTLETQEDTSSTTFNLLIVDAAQFPPVVSSSNVNKNGSGSIITGNIGNEIIRLGVSVSSAGDINGDGIDDILIGSDQANYNRFSSGAGVVIFGKEGGLDPDFQLSDIDGTNGFIITNSTQQSHAGESVSSLGDINGDGLDDLAVGAPGYAYYTNIPERVFIVFGSREEFPKILNQEDLDGTNGFTIENTSGQTAFGRNIGHVGDVNGDGLNDIMIGSPLFISEEEKGVMILFGRDHVNDPFPSSVGTKELESDERLLISDPDFTRFNLNEIGDINNDGIDDFEFTASRVEVNNDITSKHYIIFGNESLADTLDLSTINGTNGFILSDGLNVSVSRAGDFNGDGIDDVILGSQNEAYVLFGRESAFNPIFDINSLNNSNGIKITNAVDISVSGRLKVNGARDVNGDGIDDVILGKSGRNNSDRVAVAYVIFGQNNWEGDSFNLENINGRNGFSIPDIGRITNLSGLGDVNNDGFDDVIIGSGLIVNSEIDFGQVYILYGKGPAAPVLENPITDQSVQVNFAFNLTLPDSTFSDANFGDMGAYAAGLENGDPLPSWLSFDADSKAFSGTPELADVAVYSIIVTLTDEDNLTASDTFNLNVLENIAAPIIDPISTKEIDENKLLTFTITASDLESLIFSLDDGSVNQGMNLSSDGTFSWTPSETQSGEFTVTATVSDGNLSSEEEFMIIVNEVNSAPILNTIQDLEASAEKEFTFTVGATDTDIPVQDLSFKIDSISFNKGMRIDAASGLISWTPTEEQEGEHSVLLTVTDGELSDSLSFGITVTEPLAVKKRRELDINVFPNPVAEQLHLELNDSFSGEEVEVIIQTLAGVTMLSKTVHKTTEFLNVSRLESGTYLLVLISENGKKQITTLVKQ